MYRFVVLAVFVAVAAASPVVITPFAPIEGVIACGSQGKMLDMRVTNCTALPCDLKVGNTYSIEVDFIPVASHPFLTVLGSVISEGKETTIINQDVQVAVEANKAYTVAYPLYITGNLVAKGPVAMRIQVTQGGIVELCGLARALIHD